MYGDFVFDLFSVYQDVKPKILLEAGEFTIYEGRPSIFWDMQIPEELKASLTKFSFAVDTYTSEGKVQVLAQYTKEESIIESTFDEDEIPGQKISDYYDELEGI